MKYNGMNSRSKYGSNKEEDRRIRESAKRYIASLEAQGAVINPAFKADLAETFNRVTDQRLRSDKSRFTPSSIKANQIIGWNITEGVASSSGSENPYTTPVTVKVTHNKASGSELNEALERISEKKAEGFHVEKLNIHADLERLLRQMNEGQPLEAGMTNQYFTISDDWDGKQQSLFENVEFKDTLKFKRQDAKIMTSLVKMMYTRTPYMKEETEREFKDSWHEKAYQTNLDQTANQISRELGVKVTASELETLREIMNTSAAWNIAKRHAPDSDQTKDNWNELTKLVWQTEAVGSSEEWETLISMIDNEDSIEDIRSFVDGLLRS